MYLYVFQDAASSVLHSPAVCDEAAGGLALEPGSPSGPDLLPGKWRMGIPEDFRQNCQKRLTVSTGMFCMCMHGGSLHETLKKSLNCDCQMFVVTARCHMERQTKYRTVCKYFGSGSPAH